MSHTENPLPTVSFPELWHVGSLCPEDKKNWSLEGQGLSVSLHPDDWSCIASLSGPTWRLTKTKNTFLDYHRLTTATRKQIADWGIERGYVERKTVFSASWFDDEWDQMMSMTFLTREEALDQVDDEEERVEEQISLVATAGFPDHTVSAGDIDPSEILSVLWGTEKDFDGVWWNDAYDPSRLSAPRGVIRVDKVTDWDFAQI